ncbi:MAG: squalene/phytoene synthase family protein [Pseudomonadota bacterium]
MAEPALSAPAALARRADPDLFLAALFAPEPQRERLMVLTAFDIELSRATSKAAGTAEGPLIAEMRLQFWRDRLSDAAGEGAPGTAICHEIATPLQALFAGPLRVSIGEADRLVAGHAMALERPFEPAAFRAWCRARFGGWYALAIAACGGGAPETLIAAAGQAAGAAFALRSAPGLAAEGQQSFLPEGDARVLAREGLEALGEARRQRRMLPRAALPALLPLWRAERDLRAVAGRRAEATALPPPSAAARALGYLTRATTGRW